MKPTILTSQEQNAGPAARNPPSLLPEPRGRSASRANASGRAAIDGIDGIDGIDAPP